MRSLAAALIFLAATSGISQAGEPLVLANEAWPPFVMAGDEMGTAEKLVCTALERSGWSCKVEIHDWSQVLEEARSGTIDGIVAAWRSPGREEYLLFSEPYMVNRIVAAISLEHPVDIQSTADLMGRRVAMVADYAYGEEVEAMNGEFFAITAGNTLEAITFVLQGRADLALVDELAAMAELEASQITSVGLSNAVLASRELHFAVSTRNAAAARILDDFSRGYQAMLSDGTVNEILNIDWLATEFGHQGETELILRNGADLDQLKNPSRQGSVYSTGANRYSYGDETGGDDSRVKYQVKGKTHSDLQSALNSAFGTELPCEHNEFSSEFDCTKLLKPK